MKKLLKEGYRPKLRPSGHDISGKFANEHEGAIAPNLIAAANTDSNSAYLRRCKEQAIKPHPARFPEVLPEFFIQFLTDADDLVLDPFAGSSVTGAVAEALNRRWMCFEIVEEYLTGAALRFEDQLTQPALLSGVELDVE